MKKEDKLKYVIPLYNSVSKFQNYFLSSVYENVKYNNDFDSESISLAALSMIMLNIILLKEDIIENEGNLVYSSKIYDENLEDCFKFIAEEQNGMYKLGNVIDKAPKLFAMIRNKIAHGDYYITKDSIILNQKDGEIKININLFIKFFNSLNEQVNYARKSNEYKKTIVYNKGSSKIQGPFKTEKEVEEFIKLFSCTTYKLTRLDKKQIPYEMKQILIAIINSLNGKVKNVKDIKNYLEPIQEKLLEDGYVLNIENKKIKDQDLIKKIKTRLLSNTDSFESIDVPTLIWIYGDIVTKVINDTDCDINGIITASQINVEILSQMIISDSTVDLRDIVKRMRNSNAPLMVELYRNEIFVSCVLAMFINLYAYCLDDVYKKDNNYHLNRDNMLDFSKLDLSELEPDVLNINKIGLDQAKQKLSSSVKNKEKAEEKLKKLMGYIDGISKKDSPSIKEINKLKEFTQSLSKVSDKIEEYNQTIIDDAVYYDKVCEDFVENPKYFKNLAIIEGIRNSIAHGNIKVFNDYTSENFNNTKVKFTNIYEGKVAFQLTANLYQLESLFSEKNLKVLEELNYNRKVKRI